MIKIKPITMKDFQGLDELKKLKNIYCFEKFEPDCNGTLCSREADFSIYDLQLGLFEIIQEDDAPLPPTTFPIPTPPFDQNVILFDRPYLEKYGIRRYLIMKLKDLKIEDFLRQGDWHRIDFEIGPCEDRNEINILLHSNINVIKELVNKVWNQGNDDILSDPDIREEFLSRLRYLTSHIKKNPYYEESEHQFQDQIDFLTKKALNENSIKYFLNLIERVRNEKIIPENPDCILKEYNQGEILL